eukprot:1003335-Pleurochrysis_carterae.AAC.1
MSREESRLKRLPSSSVLSMKVVLNFLDLSLNGLKRWFLNLGLSPESFLYCGLRCPPGKAGREP